MEKQDEEAMNPDKPAVEMTARECMSLELMTAMYTNPLLDDVNHDAVAQCAVEAADYLIASLTETGPEVKGHTQDAGGAISACMCSWCKDYRARHGADGFR